MSKFLFIYYFIFLLSFVPNKGFFNPKSFAVVFAVFIIGFIGYFFRDKFKIYLQDNVKWAQEELALFFLLNVVLYILFFGGIYFQNTSLLLVFNIIFLFLPFLPVIFIFKLNNKIEYLYKVNFVVLLFFGFLIKIMILEVSPRPAIDVYEMFKNGPLFLVRGENPYTQIYPKVYENTNPSYYTYFPLSLFPFIPFNILFADPRTTYIFVEILIVAMSYKILKTNKKIGRAKYLIPLFFVYHPISSFVLEQSWSEVLIFFAYLTFIYFYFFKKKSVLSSVALAFFFGIKHSYLIFAPSFLVWRLISKRIIFLAFSIVFFVGGIFFLWSPSDFISDTVLFFKNYPAKTYALTFDSFYFFLFKTHIPRAVGLILVLLVLMLLSVRNVKEKSLVAFTLSIFIGILALTVFNDLSFVNYYYLASLFLLLGITLHIAEQK